MITATKTNFNKRHDKKKKKKKTNTSQKKVVGTRKSDRSVNLFS